MAIGLAVVGRELGQELVVGDACGGVSTWMILRCRCEGANVAKLVTRDLIARSAAGDKIFGMFAFKEKVTR
ncbi:hypothetical protein V1282_005766 [Nitrobacteraceae bacterium AZCC 2146]